MKYLLELLSVRLPRGPKIIGETQELLEEEPVLKWARKT